MALDKKKADFMTPTAKNIPGSTVPSGGGEVEGVDAVDLNSPGSASTPPSPEALLSHVGENREEVKQPEWYIDPISGQWIKGVKPGGVIGARSMTEFEHESAPSAVFNTDLYDQELSYVWVPRDMTNPSTVDAYSKGCTPFGNNGRPSPHGHRVERVAGFGERPVVVHGDCVLFCRPRALHEAQEERRRELSRRRKEDRSNPNIANTLVGEAMESVGVRGSGRDGYIESMHGRALRNGFDMQIGEYSPDSGGVRPIDHLERTRMMAEDIDAAHRKAGTGVYGSFQGDPRFNRGIPDSKLNVSGRPIV